MGLSGVPVRPLLERVKNGMLESNRFAMVDYGRGGRGVTPSENIRDAFAVTSGV